MFAIASVKGATLTVSNLGRCGPVTGAINLLHIKLHVAQVPQRSPRRATFVVFLSEFMWCDVLCSLNVQAVVVLSFTFRGMYIGERDACCHG